MKTSKSRRDFLKTSTAAAAGLAVAGTLIPRNAQAAWPASGTMEINQAISNLRVVCCHDTNMVTKSVTSWSVANQNGAVNLAQVEANLDGMAKSLAQKATFAEAWAAIFQEPAKGYAASKVAIKVNVKQRQNIPRVAVIGKICKVLHTLGVPYANMTVYDGCTGMGVDASVEYAAYMNKEIPSGVIVSSYNSSLGGMSAAPVPGFSNKNCTTDVRSGAIDILVNIAVNKGHGDWAGTCTLTQKNHYGTFEPYSHSDVGYVTGINKSDAIIGGTPVRQQLCIIDSLWGASSGPDGAPDYRLDRLIMGTFGPSVDYITCKRIRESLMSVTANANVTRFMTDFGYQSSQYSSLNFIDVTPETPTGITYDAVKAGSDQGEFTLMVAAKHFKSVSINLPAGSSAMNGNITIYASNGRMIRDIPVSQHSMLWDGLDSQGISCAPGTYLVKLTTGSMTTSGHLNLAR